MTAPATTPRARPTAVAVTLAGEAAGPTRRLRLGRHQGDEAFVAESQLMRGSPEMKSIAREHLAVCLDCTLRNLRPEESAALLLKEVHGFTEAARAIS